MKKNYSPKISVIIPVYNAEKYVKNAIQSITKQSLREIEIICINDGSTDKSLNVCKDEAEKDKRIIVITQINKGVSAARNKGIEIATGKYSVFLDSDDYYSDGSLNTMYDDMEQTSVDAIFYNHFYDYNGKFVKRNARLKSGKYKFEDIAEIILDDGTMTGILFGSACGVIYRTEVIKNNKITFNEQLSFNEDGIFNIECLSKAKTFIYYGEKHLYAYRQHKSFSNLNIDILKEKIEATNDYIKNNINFLKDKEIQLKRRELTTAFQQAVLICQSQKKLNEIKDNIDKLWKNFNFSYFTKSLDFSKINFYKKVLAFLICFKQKILFICLIKYVYSFLKGVIKR